MNIEIANSMCGYFETLYIMNQNLIRLCGAEIFYYRFSEFEKLTLDIIQDIPRLIPYSYDNKKQDLILDNSNGLLEYQAEIKYINGDYQNILDNYKDTLNKIRKIRNKYEHKMHDVKYQSSGTGTMSLFDIEFKVNNEFIRIYAGELIKLIKEVNILFSKIAQKISIFAYQNGKEGYAYYERICRFDFKDFNEIYESNILRQIGKVMNKF
ncbi:MAG: hypothetical protein ACI4UE_00730 [Candidatus Scatovivens sp.]